MSHHLYVMVTAVLENMTFSFWNSFPSLQLISASLQMRMSSELLHQLMLRMTRVYVPRQMPDNCFTCTCKLLCTSVQLQPREQWDVVWHTHSVVSSRSVMVCLLQTNCITYNNKNMEEGISVNNCMWPVDDIFILPSVITSLCLDTVSARMGIAHLLLSAQLPGTHWVMICVIQHLALTVSDICLKLSCFQSTSTYSALELSHFMCYINSRLIN